MLRCIEQKVCNISNVHPNQKMKFNDWYMKIDPPMWVSADFECMSVLINDSDNDNDNNNDNDNVNDNDNDDVTDKLFVNKPVGLGYNIVKNPEYDNLNLKKNGSIKFFGEDCVEWFINEMLEIEGYKKNCFKKEIGIILDTNPKNYESTCWLGQKEVRLKDEKENSIVKDHCHLTGEFKGLAHNNCNLDTRKAYTSFVPIIFHNFSGYDCHLIFEKLVNMPTE